MANDATKIAAGAAGGYALGNVVPLHLFTSLHIDKAFDAAITAAQGSGNAAIILAVTFCALVGFLVVVVASLSTSVKVGLPGYLGLAVLALTFVAGSIYLAVHIQDATVAVQFPEQSDGLVKSTGLSPYIDEGSGTAQVLLLEAASSRTEHCQQNKPVLIGLKMEGLQSNYSKLVAARDAATQKFAQAQTVMPRCFSEEALDEICKKGARWWNYGPCKHHQAVKLHEGDPADSAQISN